MSSNIIKSNDWVLIDVKNKILGRAASKIACILTGKSNINYNYNSVSGYQVIVINARHIMVSGNKVNNKFYYRHSGFPGGLKILRFKEIFSSNPSFVLRNAISGMLPKNKLRKIFLRRIRIYSDDIHPHMCQKPQNLNI
ncbi:MAG TPA: 50S ribosomal protein L13 [Candidatus Azoamicus sp.]